MVEILIVLFAWHAIGAMICVVWCAGKFTNGWELCNPNWTYRYHKNVNWLGAIMLSLLFTVLCPIGAIGYWAYKIFTVGRR